MMVRYKFWFESDRGYILGEGGYQVLKEIEKCGSIYDAARNLGMSYRHAWGKIKEIEKNLGKKLVISQRGGKEGGKTILTSEGRKLILEFEKYRELFEYVVKHPYKRPALTVDGLIIENGKILLIKRGKEPFKGHYALPGGFVEYGEKVEDAVVREVMEETGLKVKPLKIIGVYSDPKRDPRGHTVSIAFLLQKIGGSLKGGDDAISAEFFPIQSLPPLAFDHEKIISDCIKELNL
ncbi:NUDIX hydrolase [Euryarchaeota archaeon ex4484_178]|nr:MAG: NUDIX hydrolase [Euryarchaeota archaeon ex4484_178]